MGRCTSHCCRSIPFEYSPRELWSNYDAWARGDGTLDDYGRAPAQDIHLIAPMLHYLGEFETNPVKGCEELREPKKRYYYSCKFLAPSGDCSIYERRPQMCRTFPNGQCFFKSCTYG